MQLVQRVGTCAACWHYSLPALGACGRRCCCLSQQPLLLLLLLAAAHCRHQIAVEGCCHGELDALYATLAHLEKVEGRKVDLLICCGDFQVRPQQ